MATYLENQNRDERLLVQCLRSQYPKEIRRAHDARSIDLAQIPQVFVPGHEKVRLEMYAVGYQEVIFTIPSDCRVWPGKLWNEFGHTAKGSDQHLDSRIGDPPRQPGILTQLPTKLGDDICGNQEGEPTFVSRLENKPGR